MLTNFLTVCVLCIVVYLVGLKVHIVIILQIKLMTQQNMYRNQFVKEQGNIVLLYPYCWSHPGGHNPKGVFRVWVPLEWTMALDLVTNSLVPHTKVSVEQSIQCTKQTLQAIPAVVGSRYGSQDVY